MIEKYCVQPNLYDGLAPSRTCADNILDGFECTRPFPQESFLLSEYR